ncbi:caspase family protein [uncultured Methylobacterium sp.]|uniref:caspase family protein n=1 Tax=uncultured Methylobacterium sp. TaxID=157278 RepID=UPI0035CB95E8
MMRSIGAMALGLCLAAWPARAADRLAFVVGIDAYANLGADAQLQRPVADAQAVGAALRRLGFRVTLLTASVTQETFWARFGQFAEAVQPGDTALFYFAGHGLALQGSNYLLPADMPVMQAGQEQFARSRSLAEADISAALREHGARVVMMVLDACRNNPFPRTGTRGLGAETGLARRGETADGVFSLYAAGAGQTALDRMPGADPDPNSVFTRVFIRRVQEPGLNLIDLGESVRDEVARLAESVPHKQVPAYYNEVRGARFISLADPSGMPAVVTPPPIAPAVVPRPQPPAAVAPADPPRAARVASFGYPINLDPHGDNWVALRSLPSGSAGARLAKLGPETLFTVLGRQGAWVNVALRGGQVGWVHRDYVGCCRRIAVGP